MAYIKLTLTAFFWGGTFIAGKGLAGEVDPYPSVDKLVMQQVLVYQ